MSKILGFTKNGGEDWFVSSPYGQKEIQAIPDPEGGHATNAPTAIPSPFARIDLVRKSFENIAESPDLAFLQQSNKVIASKEDEKLVSHSLDLAEILFFYNNYKNNIKIVAWDRVTQISELKRSSDSGHRRLGEVLELYLDQDKLTFNFDMMNSIYLVKFNHQVIGGTSPLTMFFSAGFDISGLNLTSSKGKTYFKDIIPLYNRDIEFQKYLYLLFNNYPELGKRMKAFREYLNKSLLILRTVNNRLFMELNALNASELESKYTDLNTSKVGQVVEVHGVSLRTVDPDVLIKAIRKSDFVICSTKNTSAKLPLVLQNSFNKPLKYVNAEWDSRTAVPFVDSNPLNTRILPGQDIVYPYLTYSDFLEHDIIRLVYPINSQKYFDGNLKLDNPEATKSFLLPIKPLFFEYFSVDDLINGGIGKPSILIEDAGVRSAIRVLLKIPVANGKEYIQFERVYHDDGTSDEKSNKGGIREHQFGLTIFPFVRQTSAEAFYNIQLVDRDVTGKHVDADYTLGFYKDNQAKPLVPEFQKSRNSKQKGDVSKVGTKLFSLNSSFDYIQVENQFASGLIIPKWKSYSNNGDQYTFAVDFGTTNTHIEYSLNSNTPKPFEILKEDIQAVPLLSDVTDHNFSGTGAIDIRTSIAKEFVPEIISKDTSYNFPHRTVIAQSKTNAPTNGGKALVDYNIPVIFEKSIDNNNRFFTNLKWDSREPNNDFRVKAFLEELIILIRNKVLMNDGDLNAAKVLWTYPTSMSFARKSHLQSAWNDLFKKYINSNNTPIDISESIAPYYYFQGNAKLQGLGHGVSVLMDIGGGTSDVVVYESNVPKLISSYKFAGNTLFGDGYNVFGDVKNNKLISKFKQEFDEVLTKNSPTLKSISDDLYNQQKSADYNTFLFSLINNNEVKEKEVLNYNRKIAADKDIKIIFLYFYCAKVYHIAQLMSFHKIDLPMNMVFSGNGAKILNIITPNQELISNLTKIIFLKVYGLEDYLPVGLKINIEKDFPKEVTCKGALIHHIQGIHAIEISKLKKIYTCMEDEGKSSLSNQEVTEEVKNRIVAKVKGFNQFFIELNKTLDFEEYFDISPPAFNSFKEIVNDHVKAYLEAGIRYNHELDGLVPQPEALIPETLFFYPIVETIQQLIDKLTLSTNQD
jgi:hypothetical protein